MKSEQNRRLRVGIVGAGNISAAHLRTLVRMKDIEVVGIADVDRAKAQDAAAKFAVPATFGSLAELAGAGPDVVHILTPPSSHCPLAIEALERGLHVFVEKPMALTTAECDRMAAAAVAAGRRLSVNHSARFDPAVLQALKLVRAGAIGDVLSVDYVRSSEYPPFSGGSLPAHYRDGGYPFRDIGVHALYIIEEFLGEIRDVRAAYASTGRNFHLTFDEWHATVECAKGAAHIYLSWNSHPIENGMIVHGTGGALVIDSFLETCIVRRQLPGPKVVSLLWNGVFGSLQRAAGVCVNTLRFATGKLGPAPDIERSIQAFYEALREDKAAPVQPEEGRRTVYWLDKAAGPADLEKLATTDAKEPLKPASILVTGASGFLGRATVAALIGSDKTLRLLSRRRPPEEIAGHPAVTVVTGDLGQPEVVDRAMRGIDVVYHIGAATGGSAEEYQSGTLWGTRNVLEAAMRHGVKRVVYVSSLSVLDYVKLRHGNTVDESAEVENFPQKRGLYAQTKLEAERMVLAACEKGLDAVILRPGQIFGPGAEKVSPYGVISAGNRWVVMGRGWMKLPLVYVDDVVDAMLTSAEAKGVRGKILQLVDSETVTQREYLDLCTARFPEIRPSYVPLAVLYAAAAGLEILGKLLGRSVPLTFYRLRSLKSVGFNCSAARDAIGWVPRTGIRRGLQVTFAGSAPARVQAPAQMAAKP